MDQLRDMFRGFDFFNDNPTLVFLILGLVVLLILSNGDLECFFWAKQFTNLDYSNSIYIIFI